MSSSVTALLIVAVFCLVLGGVVGFLLGAMRDDGGDVEGDARAKGADAPPGGRKGKYQAVARLWREKTSQALIVEVDGKAFVAADPLSAEQRARLGQAASALARWTGGAPVERLRPVMESAPAPVPAQATAAPAAPVIPAPEPVFPAPVQPAAAVSNGAPLPASITAGKAPAARVEMKSVVQQIDAVVKEMAAGTPYEALQITLAEDPHRGVLVWIGANCYEGFDGVPDAQIQALLRSAAAEWERRQDLLKSLR